MKGLPFKLKMAWPRYGKHHGRVESKTDNYAEINPRGTIPAIDDDGFILWESHAIMTYLCEKHGWIDMWPSDLQRRAKVSQYLHFHHRNVREAVVVWSRTIWPAVFGKQNPSEKWLARNTFPGLQNHEEVVAQSLVIVEGMLASTAFLVGDECTLADLAAYEELGQNQPKYANCLDYSSFPNIQRWLVSMEALPMHGEAHSILPALGNLDKLQGGGLRAIARANKDAVAVIEAAVQQLSQRSMQGRARL
jgi:glutathione S-transferase